MVSIASVAITASQHIWSSDLILLVGPKVVYISLTWWQSKLSLFSALYSQPEQLTVAERIIIFFFLNTWQDPALWGRGSLVWKIEPGVLSGFVCFGENRSVTVKHTSKTDGLFTLSYFCFGDQSDSRFQCWRAIHCAHSGGDVHHLDSLRWAAQKCHDGASSQFDEQHCFFSQQNRWAFLLDSSGINRMIIKYFIVL